MNELRSIPRRSYRLSLLTDSLRVDYEFGQWRHVYLFLSGKEPPRIIWTGLGNGASIDDAHLLATGLVLAIADSSLGKDALLEKLRREVVTNE